jgi:putative chitinase
MKFDRKTVFDGLRKDFGKMDDVQVSVIAAMVDEFERRQLTDMRWLSYILATGWGESAWKPVREIGRGKGKKYGKPARNGQVYYGRGCPTQITWDYNYQMLGDILNMPLLDDPDMALLVPVGVAIGFEGMIRGVFTGKKLGDYFSATVDDPVNARRIINGKDRAKQFAGYHAKILVTLGHAVRMDVPAQKPSADVPKLDVKVPAKPVLMPKDVAGGAGAVVVSGGAAVAAGFDWKLVAMVAGCVAIAAVIVWFIIKLRKET